MSDQQDLFPETSQWLDAVLGHLRWTVWSLADEVKDVGPGWLARSWSLPDVWALNQLRITRPAPPREVLALSEDQQGDLPFRHIRVEPEATALEMVTVLNGALNGAGLKGPGWKVDREVLMALMAEPTRQVGAEAVVELSEPQMAWLMRRWLSEDFPNIDPSRLDQVVEYAWREGRLWGERCFGILGDGGAAAAITKLRSRDSTGWVEDVYTVPEERARGFARALVTYAAGLARAAGYEVTFIIADDNDWPKHLYESIGFRPLGKTWTFHREIPRG
jgi:GNAT superfamily N-acetyltransferase